MHDVRPGGSKPLILDHPSPSFARDDFGRVRHRLSAGSLTYWSYTSAVLPAGLNEIGPPRPDTAAWAQHRRVAIRPQPRQRFPARLEHQRLRKVHDPFVL